MVRGSGMSGNDGMHDTVVDAGALSPVATLLAAAMERVERQGIAAIEAVCAENPEHAAELRRRFAALADLGLLEGPRTFGHYRVLRTLGQGGMGIVYLARDERLGRLVALKALPARLSGNPRALARFQREIKAVAQLRHPGIVSIHAMGREEGIPYFTMEYIEGRTLADVVDEVRALELPPGELRAQHLAAESDCRSWVEAICHVALDVAEALEHAHAHGVVHRDVKPSNILLRPDGRALLFDFGLARIEDEQGLTLTGDFAGTPYYVSPEQVSARTAALDRRTDVYSLGVTLYELLTLRRPFEGATTEQVFRQITSREPALLRRSNPLVPRDLQTVCLTAMEKEPARRYQSAGDLAADLRAFLEYRPVRARPVGALLRGMRFVRRNPAVSVAALCGALLLVGTPIGLGVANIKISAQRERALVEFDRAEAALKREQIEAESARLATAAAQDKAEKANKALGFLISVLTSADPLRDDRNLTMVEVLHRAEQAVGPALADEPYMEAMLRQNIGLTFKNLGLYPEAEAQFRRTIELCEPEDAFDRDYQLALAWNNLAIILGRTERLAEARAIIDQALELAPKVPTITFDMYTSFLNNSALIRSMSGDKAGALEAYREALRRRLEQLPEDHPRTLEAMINVAANIPDYAECEAEYRRILAIQERTLPEGDPQMALVMGNLAIAIFVQGRVDEAAELQERDVAMLRARLPSGHVDIANACIVLGMMRSRQERHEEARELLEEGIAGLRATFPGGHSRLVTALRTLADELAALGRDEECVPLLEEALAMQLAVRPDAQEAVETCRQALIEALRRLGRDGEADAVAEAAAG
jgi:eukaryotic-like serine/threonine-protein kinase